MRAGRRAARPTAAPCVPSGAPSSTLPCLTHGSAASSIERMLCRAVVLALGVALAMGCTPIRPLDVGDGGMRVDAASTPDAMGVDAPSPPDGGADAGGCHGPDLCNGIDDDCDPTTPD